MGLCQYLFHIPYSSLKSGVPYRSYGVPSFVVRNLASCARSYTVEELENAVRDFVDAEEAVKTGTLGDVLSVELLIVKYSSARAVRA